MEVINTKWESKNCPMCGKNHWSVDDSIVTLVGVDENRSIKLGGKFSPLVAFTCSECGYVILVNPLVIQAVDGIDEDKE